MDFIIHNMFDMVSELISYTKPVLSPPHCIYSNVCVWKPEHYIRQLTQHYTCVSSWNESIQCTENNPTTSTSYFYFSMTAAPIFILAMLETRFNVFRPNYGNRLAIVTVLIDVVKVSLVVTLALSLVVMVIQSSINNK